MWQQWDVCRLHAENQWTGERWYEKACSKSGWWRQGLTDSKAGWLLPTQSSHTAEEPTVRGNYCISKGILPGYSCKPGPLRGWWTTWVCPGLSRFWSYDLRNSSVLDNQSDLPPDKLFKEITESFWSLWPFFNIYLWVVYFVVKIMGEKF